MTAEQFTYWLQGFMEIANPAQLGEKEIQIIKDHLALVFDKQTPQREPFPFGTPQVVPYTPSYTPPYEPGKPYWEIDPNRVYCSPTEFTTFTTNTPIRDMTDSNAPIAGSLDAPTKKPSRREKFPNIKC
jgi:hypothetical protein